MFDVLIVGGGLAGSALAHYCSQRGLNTMLLEAETIGGAGATKYSRGIVRVYDPLPTLMRWSLAGVEEWANFNMAGLSPFTDCGVVYIVAEQNVRDVTKTIAAHDQARYPIQLLDQGGLMSIAPQFGHLLPAGGLALYEPRGGYVDTRLAARMFAQSALEHGATLIEGSAVQSLSEQAGQVVVHATHAELQARLVVVAAGAKSPQLLPQLDMFTRSIPLSCFYHAGDGSPEQCLIDEPSGGYLRPDRGGVFFCGGAPQQDVATPDALTIELDASGAYNRTLTRHLLNRDQAILLDTCPGYDGYTQDFLPLLGVQPGHPRLVLATGFSGRGAKYIPAAVSSLAGEICTHLKELG
jgi:glycine/D-amino acid oxidase-like deaminating enzyme